METIKMLHTADTGLKNLPYGGLNPDTGLNRRFEDVVNNFRYIVSLAIKEGVKYFVIAGDVNEERNPESILIEVFSGFVADLISKDIKVIMISGNHDLDGSKGTSTSISYLKELGLVNTYIADTKCETFEFDDSVFHCVPYMFPNQVGCEDNDELSAWLKEYIENIKTVEGKNNILVSHYSLESTFAGLDVDEPVLHTSTFKRFDYVALGHIHKYEMGKDYTGGYSGSLFVKDFGEQKDKFVNIVNFYDGVANIDKIEVPERQFAQFDLDCVGMTAEEMLESVKTTAEDIQDKVVKLKIKARKRINPKLIYDYLRDSKVFHYTPIEWDIDTGEHVKKLDVVEGMDDKGVVGKYLDGKEYEPEHQENLQCYINKVVDKWDDCSE